MKEDFEVGAHKEITIKNALQTTDDNCEDSVRIDRHKMDPPTLVADTFSSDRLLLGHGICIAAPLGNNKVMKEANSCDETRGYDLSIILNENDARASLHVSRTNGKQILDKFDPAQISSSRFKYNFTVPDRMPERSRISSKNTRRPAITTAAPTEIRTRSRHDSVANYKTILYINIDNFGEKLWRNPGVEMSDFFNYGLDEEQWKDYYCKLMQAQVQVTSSRQIKVSADESIQSHKDGSTSEVNLDTGIDEHLPFIYYKDMNSCDSDVIIEIIKREPMKEEGELTDPETLCDSRNIKHIKCRMINGDKILPFPMDSYPAKDSKSMSAETQKKSNEAMYTQQSSWSNEQNYQSWYDKEMVELVRSNKTRMQHSFAKERERSLSHVGHKNQKKARFLTHQTSHHKLDINLAKSLCSPRVKSVFQKTKNNVSQGVYNEFAKGVISADRHKRGKEKEVEGDLEKLKRRSERFKLPLRI